MSARADFAAAADDLAGRVLSALRGAEGVALAAWSADGTPDPMTSFAAVRVIGADTFAPQALAGAPFDAEGAAVVARSFEMLPLPGAGRSGRQDERTMAWRDWATAQFLARFGGTSAPGVNAAPPQDGLADTVNWQRWSVRMAQLATLAAPGLDGPVHEAVRNAALPLCQGVTRSVLRRDFPTAVRLARWLAWLHREGVALPLDPVAVTEHVRLLGGGGPRAALDLAIAGCLLGRKPDAEAADA
ncbi:hypothetical protein SNS2_3181 [Streptomyces netropsis]|nr:hypothetical protein SNS2_3181 [Streptomyces netropsis]